MLRIVAAGATALFVTASSLAYAQAPTAMGQERFSQADFAKLTDARIQIIKAALQLTPEQMKYWPAVENAIRARAEDRQARIGKIAETVGKAGEGGGLGDRDPVDFMNRRADALAQRSADLKKLAAAWQPLVQTLTPEQKLRMGALAVLAVREVRDLRQSYDDDDE